MPGLSFKTAALGALCCLSVSAPAAARQTVGVHQMMQDRVPLDDGTSYYGDPQTVQQAYDELVYETTSNCVGYCYSMTDPTDPDPQIIGDAGDHPEASTTTEPGGIQANPSSSTPTTEPFVKAFHKDDSFGSKLFGGGYVLDGKLVGDRVNYTLEASGEAKAWARLFYSAKNDVVRATAKAVARQGAGDSSLDLKLYVLGAELYSKTMGNTEYAEKNLFEAKAFDMTFFQAEAVVYKILFLDVKVKAKATGKAGITVKGGVRPTGAKLAITGLAGIYASASAEVNAWVVSVGVEGSLTLVEASLPIAGQLAATTCGNLDWDLRSSLTLKAMQGKLRAYVKIKLFIFKKKGYLNIAKWSGTLQGSEQSWTLHTSGGTIPFNFICANGAPAGGAAALSPPASPYLAKTDDTPPPPPPDGGGGGGASCLQGGGGDSTGYDSLRTTEACF